MSIQIWEFSEIKCSSIKLLSNAWFPVTVVPSALCTLSGGMRWWGTSNYTVDYTGNYKTFSFSGGINITRLKAEKFAFLFQKVCYWLPSNKVWCVSSIPQLVLHIADMCIHGKFQTSKKKLSVVIYKYNTVVGQAPLSIGFSRQEYRSGLLVRPPRDLPSPGIEPGFPALQPDFFTICATREAHKWVKVIIFP